LTKEVPDLQQCLGDVEVRMQEFSANLQRTNDMVSHDLHDSIDKLGEEVDTLRQRGEGTIADLERLRVETAHKGQLLQETRAVADKNAAAVASLQRGADHRSGKDLDLSRQLDSLKADMCKLQPTVESLRKDSAFLKQRQENHDAAIHTVQQNQGTLHATQETMSHKHERLAREAKALEQSLAATRGGLDHARDGLGQANTNAAALRDNVDKLRLDLHKTSQRVEGAENQHAALSESFSRVVCDAVELSREQGRAASERQALRHELEQTKAALTRARGDLDATNERLQGVGGDLGRTNEAVRRLDDSMDFCHAGFSGLQKGFIETGVHIARRPLVLPKLLSSSAHDQLGKTGITSKDLATVTRDDDSTHGSQLSSRRPSLLSAGSDEQPLTAR